LLDLLMLDSHLNLYNINLGDGSSQLVSVSRDRRRFVCRLESSRFVDGLSSQFL